MKMIIFPTHLVVGQATSNLLQTACRALVDFWIHRDLFLRSSWGCRVTRLLANFLACLSWTSVACSPAKRRRPAPQAPWPQQTTACAGPSVSGSSHSTPRPAWFCTDNQDSCLASPYLTTACWCTAHSSRRSQLTWCSCTGCSSSQRLPAVTACAS